MGAGFPIVMAIFILLFLTGVWMIESKLRKTRDKEVK